MTRRPIDIIDGITRSIAEFLSGTPIGRIPVLQFAYAKVTDIITDWRYRTVDVPDKVTYRGYDLYVFPESRWAKRLYLTGDYSGSDDHEFDLLDLCISEGDVVFDIGAFVGTHTLMMHSIVGDSGHLYSFEPQPKCVRLLEKTISANDIPNCTVVEMAVGQETGLRELTLAEGPDSTANVVGADPWAKHTTTAEVQMVRLDDFLDTQEIDHVDFMKIDVQGAELQVIEGLGNRLGDVSAIYLEIHSKYIENLEVEVTRLFEILTTQGEIFRTDTDECTHIEDVEELVYEDVHPTILWKS